MTTVTRPEAALLDAARSLFARTRFSGGEVPERLGPSAMRLLEDLLAKGCVQALARLGGAWPRGPRDRALVLDAMPAPELHFSGYTFELLRWLTARPPRPPFEHVPKTVADELVSYLAMRRHDVAERGLVAPLSWLGFPRRCPVGSDWQDALAPRIALVQGLGRDLEERWVRSVAWPEATRPAEVVLREASAERAALEGFLDAVAASGRWDLATFVVRAAARVVALPDLADRLAAPVDQQATLRLRAEARQKAGALLAGVVRIGRKREELALVHFLDEGYDEAQALLRDWEVLPREGFGRAADVLAQLAAL